MSRKVYKAVKSKLDESIKNLIKAIEENQICPQLLKIEENNLHLKKEKSR